MNRMVDDTAIAAVLYGTQTLFVAKCVFESFCREASAFFLRTAHTLISISGDRLHFLRGLEFPLLKNEKKTCLLIVVLQIERSIRFGVEAQFPVLLQPSSTARHCSIGFSMAPDPECRFFGRISLLWQPNEFQFLMTRFPRWAGVLPNLIKLRLKRMSIFFSLSLLALSSTERSRHIGILRTLSLQQCHYSSISYVRQYTQPAVEKRCVRFPTTYVSIYFAVNASILCSI